MNRERLVEALELVSPALSSNDLVPALSHYWFRDGQLMAYNDRIAISTKLSSEFRGAAPKTLLDLLAASKAKEVEFMTRDGELIVKAASSKFKLPILPETQTAIFSIPEPAQGNRLLVNIEDFLSALDLCKKSLKESPAVSSSLGVTLNIEVGTEPCLFLYSTNNATITRTSLAVKNSPANDFGQAVLSWTFCKQMISVSKQPGKSRLEINVNDGCALFTCGDTTLFGRLVETSKTADFKNTIEMVYPSSDWDRAVQIPTKMELVLDRACIIANSRLHPRTEITVKNGIASVFSSSEKGEVNDSVQLEGHPDAHTYVDPRLVRIGYDYFDKILITERCVAMSRSHTDQRGDTDLYLISPMSGSK